MNQNDNIFRINVTQIQFTNVNTLGYYKVIRGPTQPPVFGLTAMYIADAHKHAQ